MSIPPPCIPGSLPGAQYPSAAAPEEKGDFDEEVEPLKAQKSTILASGAKRGEAWELQKQLEQLAKLVFRNPASLSPKALVLSLEQYRSTARKMDKFIERNLLQGAEWALKRELSLLTLPSELLCYIMNYLPLHELAKTATVCRQLNEVTADPLLLCRRFNVKVPSAKQLLKAVIHCPNVVELKVDLGHRHAPFEKLKPPLRSALQTASKLEQLTITIYPFSGGRQYFDEIVSGLAQTSVKILNIKSPYLGISCTEIFSDLWKLNKLEVLTLDVEVKFSLDFPNSIPKLPVVYHCFCKLST